MVQQSDIVRRSFTRLGLVFAFVGAGIAGCDGKSSTTSNDPANLESPDYGPVCVEHQGFKHCQLGEAKLDESREGSSLAVTSLREADKDGVAILLPDVTEFTAKGGLGIGAFGTLIARSINEGVSTSTLTLQFTEAGFKFSAGFTGSGAGSNYTVKLYDGDKLVAGLPSRGNDLVTIWEPCFPWPDCEEIPPFRVVQAREVEQEAEAEAEAGACIWSIPLGRGGAVGVTMGDGTQVVADRLDLVEDVPGSGSYPYLTFNRIDYTANNGTIRIGDEHIK